MFLKNKDRFTAIARSYVQDEAIAKDIVAEAFGRFWENRDSVKLTELPEVYILATVKNRCLNHIRNTMRQMRIRQQMQTNAYKFLVAEAEFLASEDLSFLFHSEVEQIFRKTLAEMPEMTRNIFLASRVEELTYNEIAEKYGVTPRKVRRDISSALATLRESLKDYLPAILLAFLSL